MPQIWCMYMNLFMHPLCPPAIQYTHARRTFDHALLTVSLLLHGTPSPDVDEVESDEECSKPKMQFSLLRSRGPTHVEPCPRPLEAVNLDRKSTRLNSSHQIISYAVF